MPLDIHQNPFSRPPGSGGQPFRKQMRPAPRAKCFVCVDVKDGPAFQVPVHTRFIWNTLNIRHGFARPIKGRYAEVLAPLGAPEPTLPPNLDPSEWQMCTKSQVWLDDIPGHPAALRELSIVGSIIALNAMASLREMLSYKQEIQRGHMVHSALLFARSSALSTTTSICSAFR